MFFQISYRANNYKDCSRSPIEQYKHNADGRDEGLTKIDPDSAQAFERWYMSFRGGGHPWEIYPGGNSTHISLYVRRSSTGYFYTVAGSSVSRCIETIKIYLALKRAGLPVFLHDTKILADRVLEKEQIGIVPQGVFPRYCHSWFPNQNIVTFMNLPYDEAEKQAILPYCVWQPLNPIMLKV